MLETEMAPARAERASALAWLLVAISAIPRNSLGVANVVPLPLTVTSTEAPVGTADRLMILFSAYRCWAARFAASHENPVAARVGWGPRLRPIGVGVVGAAGL